MLKVSITGQMGSGKTFITKLFEAIGVPCLSMDIVAKNVQVKYKDLNEKLIKRFPDGYTKDGKLIKEEMRRILFFDETNQNIKDMSELFMPYLKLELEDFYKQHSESNYVIVESALLYEYNLQDEFDVVIFVDSDKDLRKSAAMKRDNISSEDYDNRMKSQISDEYKIKHSTYVIKNDFTNSIEKQVTNIHKLLWV